MSDDSNTGRGPGPGGAALNQAMDAARASAEEFTRMFADMKFPALPDTEVLLEAYKRNMEVLAQANRVAMEGAQAVGKRHMEIMQQTVAELSETMRALTSNETPQARAAKQAELLRQAYERAVNHVQELAELIRTSNTEAVGLLNKRFAEAMTEVRGLIEKSQHTG